MSRSSSRTQVSLFPFLAVLVCTMGALILLLLVTTRRIRQDVIAATVDDAVEAVDTVEEIEITVVQEPDPIIEPAVPEIIVTVPDQDLLAAEAAAAQVAAAEHEVRVQKLEQQAADLETEIHGEQERQNQLLQQLAMVREQVEQEPEEVQSDAAAELEDLRRRTFSLQGELKGKSDQLAQLKTQLDRSSEETEQVESILKRRQSALISLREIVSEAEESPGVETTLLDFTNSTGTQRMPIVIDVRDDGYEFLPMGTSLSLEDLQRFSPRDNPLVTGIAALHQYRHPNSVTVAPYVLLLVRPSGITGFYAAQRCLNATGIHFGYELLEADRKIDTGRAADAEVAALQTAMQQALEAGGTPPVAIAVRSGESTERRGHSRMRVAPDGSIIFPGESDVSDLGRYFAGGKALPESLSASARSRQHLVDARQSQGPDDFAEPLAESNLASSDETHPTAESGAADIQEQIAGTVTNNESVWVDPTPADSVAALSAGETVAEGTADVVTEPDFSAGDEQITFDEFGLPELVAAGSAASPTVPAADSFNAETGQDTNAVVFESPVDNTDSTVEPTAAERETAVTEDLIAGAFPDADGTRAELPENFDPTQFFGRSRAISGNLGVRGGQTLNPALIPEPAGERGERRTEERSTKEQPAKEGANQPQNGRRSSETPAHGTAPSSDRTGSPGGFDWPETATADADQETRTVESLGNPGVANGQPGAPATDITTGSATESFLQSLLQRNARPVRRELVSPRLIAMMSTAVANDPRAAGYHPIAMQITQQDITVFGQSRYRVHGLSQDQILQRTVQALAAEIARLPAEQREGLLPTIDYRVGRGAGRIHRQLEAGLQRLDIPTRTVVNIGLPTSTPRHPAVDAREQVPTNREPAMPEFTDPHLGRPVDSSTVPESRAGKRRLAI